MKNCVFEIWCFCGSLYFAGKFVYSTKKKSTHYMGKFVHALWNKFNPNILISNGNASWAYIYIYIYIYISSANTQTNVWIKILSGIVPFWGLTKIPHMVPQYILLTTMCSTISTSLCARYPTSYVHIAISRTPLQAPY